MIRATFDPKANGVCVYRWDNLDDDMRSYWTHDGKRINLKVGEAAPWWLVLDNGDAKALVDSLVDFLAEDPSVDREDMGYIKGLYEAQSEHLADMRKLVFEVPKK